MKELPTSKPAMGNPLLDRSDNGLIWQLIVFIGMYLLLTGLYGQAADTAWQRELLETLVSQPAAALLGQITPQIGIEAVGTRIIAVGSTLNIRNGCEGIDLLILLTAAFAATRLPLRHRLAGWSLGLMLALLANQLRIVVLFYVSRYDPALFNTLQTLAAPIALILLIAAYFQIWLGLCRRPPEAT